MAALTCFRSAPCCSKWRQDDRRFPDRRRWRFSPRSSAVSGCLSAARTSPTGCSAVIGRCIERDPSARFQSATELRVALESGTVAAASMPSHERAQLASIAVLPFADMSRERDQGYLCEGIAEELITALGHITGLKVASRTAAFR